MTNYFPALLALAFSFQSTVFAKTEVYQDQSYIYFKTPLKELTQSERGHLIRESMTMVVDYLKSSMEVAGQLNSEGKIELLKEAHEHLDPIIADIEKFANPKDFPGVRFWDLIPAGFVVFAGGTFTQGLKITGGGGIYMGIVIVPCRLIVIEKLTQKVKTYYPLDTALALMPAVRFGGGAAVGGPRASLGAGAIWGTLETASEFTGLSLGLSGSLTAFEGVSFKMALLRQYNHVRFNTFAALSYELGPSAVLEVQGTAEPIMGLGETLNSLFREGQQQVVIRDSNDHPTPNAEALKKRFGTSNKEPPPELKKIPDGDKENEKPGHNEKK